MFNLFRYEVTSRRVSILGWGIGLALFASLYVGVYPMFEEQLASFANIDFYRLFGIDMGSFAGYIASVVVQVAPIILGVYALDASTGTLAGEEDNGTLELVVAMPLKRWQIVTMKTAALAVVLFLTMLILGTGSALTLSIVGQVTEVDVLPLQLFGALLGAFPMVLAFFSIGLFLGTIVPNRRMAVTLLTFIYLGSYALNSLASIVDALSFLKTFSLFAYLNTTASVFTEGNDPAKVFVLLAVAAVFFALALVGFQRRNITVGQWFWQRGRVPGA